MWSCCIVTCNVSLWYLMTGRAWRLANYEKIGRRVISIINTCIMHNIK